MNYTITNLKPELNEVVQKVGHRKIKFKDRTSKKFAEQAKAKKDEAKKQIGRVTDIKTGLDRTLENVNSALGRLKKFNINVKIEDHLLTAKKIGQKALKVRPVTLKGTYKLKKALKIEKSGQDLIVDKTKPVIPSVVPSGTTFMSTPPPVIDFPSTRRSPVISDDAKATNLYGGNSPTVLPVIGDRKDLPRPAVPNSFDDNPIRQPSSDGPIDDKLNKLEERVKALKTESRQLQEETAQKTLELKMKRDEINEKRMQELMMEAEILRRNIKEAQRQRDELESQIQTLNTKNSSEDNFTRRAA